MVQTSARPACARAKCWSPPTATPAPPSPGCAGGWSRSAATSSPPRRSTRRWHGGYCPRGRVMSDTWNLLHYFRLSDDGRLVFGGRASFTPTGVARSARILAAAMRRVFPVAGAVPIEYAWSGRVAFARDRMPHAGRSSGMHYALGYAGHGVALSTWLGAADGRGAGGTAARYRRSRASCSGRSRSTGGRRGSCPRWVGTID